ncbi:MAG: DUF4340 domain-containing protein [Candidatus Poribacteria bacterium]|nr:DUF4340 domain-containing protein [Candidatus Poribacteria bacterium]
MNFKTTLIILAVFVVLAGAYLLFLQPSTDSEKPVEGQQKIREVYGLDKDKIRRIGLSFKDESYQPMTLAKDADGQWQLTAPFAADADPAKIDEMLQNLLEKRVKRTLEATDLAQYGLRPPNIQMKLWTEAESPAKTFFIGNKTINYSVYTQEKSEAHIFLIESSALDDFTKSPSDLRDRNVFKFSPDEVAKFSLQVAGQPEIRCQRMEAGHWEMVQPVAAKADLGEMEAALAVLDTLKVAVFEADGQIEPARYGLDSPRITVAIQLADERTQELQIGGEAATTGRIYAKRSEVPSVYAVNAEIYAQLNKTVFDLRDKRVMDFQRTATNRFEIHQGESNIVCEKNVEGEWKITEPVALKADAGAVDDLLFGVDALKAVEFVADVPQSLQPYGLDSPSIQVSFMVPDAEPAVLLVGKTKDDHVYVKAQNADPVFLVKKELLALVGMGVAGLRDKQILNFNSDDAAKLVLKHGAVTLTCHKQGTNWRLVHPVQEDAKTGAVNSIVYQVNELTVEKFLAPAPTAAVTGLDAPVVQLTVTLKDRTEHTLEIGNSTGDQHRYGRLRRAPDTIFLLKKELADQLKKTVEDLRATSDGG